jgi:DEAD/DEAH box helicase domain-containing protein
MLEDIYQTLGFRVSLDKLASATLGEKKLADGVQAVQWYKEGKIDKIIEYCKKDVEITKRLHEYGCKQGFVCFTGRGGVKQPIPVNWKL